MRFVDVIGQEKLKQQLCQGVHENRVAHAQLFCGPEGCGKLALALAFANYLLCSSPTGGDSCHVCPSCVKVRKLAHPDLHFVFPVIRKKSGSNREVVSDDFINEWRTLLMSSPYFNMDGWLDAMETENQQAIIYAAEADNIQRKLSLKSSEGGRKVVIIWLPERMNVQASNKLLKLLEEPPAETFFILVCENPEQLLPTILSRTQSVCFKRLQDEVLSRALEELNGLQYQDAQRIARLSNGNYIKALRTIHIDKDTDMFLDKFISLMRLSYQRKIKEMMEWSEELSTWGRERQRNFLEYCQRLIRENFMYNFKQPDLNYLTPEEADFSSRFARFVNERNVIGIMEELTTAQRDIEQNVNPKMVFFDFSLKMIVLLIQ